MAVFGSLLAGATQSAPSVPLPTQLGGVTATINGVAAPLYFVSPGQINLQIPYATAPGSAALKVSCNGQTVTGTITVAAAAPGIFTDPANGAPVPNETAKRGQTIALYITGEGASTPLPTTGSTPAAGTTPVAVLPVAVTVGGVAADIVFKGIPSWAIGATQINYTVPANAALGTQPVVVTVGGAPSAAAMLTITQ